MTQTSVIRSIKCARVCYQSSWENIMDNEQVYQVFWYMLLVFIFAFIILAAWVCSFRQIQVTLSVQMKHRQSKDQILDNNFRCEVADTCAGWMRIIIKKTQLCQMFFTILQIMTHSSPNINVLRNETPVLMHCHHRRTQLWWRLSDISSQSQIATFREKRT